MTFRGSNSASDRGTVILVALCFVAVMAIVLGSYLAVTTRAMQLSNRGFQAELSKQLAEAGLEEALRAFNKNDWTDWTSNGMTVDWDTTTYAADKRAVATITYPADKFAQGATAEVKIRIDNYDARVLGTTWGSSVNYRPGDIVNYGGSWYRCLQSHTNQTPTGSVSTYWAPEGAGSTWSSTITYAVEDMTFYNGYWYRCASINTNSPPPNANWVRVDEVAKDTTTGVWGVQDALVNWTDGNWYRWNSGNWDSAPPISWRWRTPGKAYRFNDIVCYNKIWYRYTSMTWITNMSTTYNNPSSDTARWTPVTSMWQWSSSSRNYSVGDTVYYSNNGQWYRCIQAHTSSGSITPAISTYWADTPAWSTAWSPGPYYGVNDVIFYYGVWYRCIVGHTSSSSILPTNTSYWIGANTSTASHQWNPSTAYAINDYKCYGGVWYKCIAATTANADHNPNNTTYWTNAWSQSKGVTTGAPVIYAEAMVTLPGNPSARTQVRSPIAAAPLFPNAAGAATTITISGGTGNVDSYDALTDPTAASPGYSAVLAAGTESASGTSTLVTVGNSTNVKGYVAAPSSSTTPFAPRISFGSSAVVQGASSPVSPNTDLAQVRRSPYVPTFDILPPVAQTTITTSLPNTSYSTNLGTPGSTTPSVYYYNNNLSIAANETININGPVILYINGYLRCNTGTFKVNSTGSVVVYFTSYLRNYASSGGFQNLTLDPKKMFFIGSTSTTLANYLIASNTDPDFYGVAYLPNTTATLGLDVRTGNNIYGALSAREITFSNEANVHYDTSLRYATFQGVDQPYTVTDWRELPATEQATMP